MEEQQRKYVFRELVQNRTDALQLISYAVYKSHKDERAEHYASQQPPVNVTQKLQEWHDSIVTDPTAMAAYRAKSMDLVTAMKDEATRLAIIDIQQEHAGAIQTLTERHQAEIELLRQQVDEANLNARQAWLDQVAAWTEDKHAPKGLKKFCYVFRDWLLNAFSGTVGGVLALLVMAGVVAIFSANTRNAANSALKYAVDVVLPEKTIETGIISPAANKKTSEGVTLPAAQNTSP